MRKILHDKLSRPIVALAGVLCLFAQADSAAGEELDATSAFILEALTSKSQQKHGPVTVEFDKMLVHFAYSANVPDSLQQTLERSLQLMAIPALELRSCMSWRETERSPTGHCPDEGTKVLVLLAKGAEDLRTLVRDMQAAWPDAEPNADTAADVTDRITSMSNDLGKEGPPVCVYTRDC